MYHNKLLAAWYAPQTPQVSVPKWISCCNQSNGHLGGDVFTKYFFNSQRLRFCLITPLSCSVNHFFGVHFFHFLMHSGVMPCCLSNLHSNCVCVCVQKHFFNANFIHLLTPWWNKLVLIFHSGGACDNSWCLLHWVNHIRTFWEFCDFQSIGWIDNCGICDLPLHWVDWQLWNLWFATPLGGFTFMVLCGNFYSIR